MSAAKAVWQIGVIPSLVFLKPYDIIKGMNKEVDKEKKEVIKISVRNLVEFILRSGDIDNRRGMAADKEAMQMGSRIHRKIQRQMGSDYRAEVSLKYIKEYDEYDVLVEGRADGIIENKKGTMIDEIKGSFMDIELLEEPVDVHLAQGKCYAYMYSLQNNLEDIAVQMTYVNLETEEVRRFKETYTFVELKEWFHRVLEAYKKWTDFQFHWRRERNASVRATEFPFAYRDGQRELVTAVYRTMLRQKRLFIQASTGVGKTLATLFPAVKAAGEGLGEKIFYLTARTTTRTVAQEAFGLLGEAGLKWKVLTITAKEKMCFCEEALCYPAACPYAEGHYDRVNEAVYALINEVDNITREWIEEYAREYRVCPYELTLDAALWCDAIICDYNYVFDPTVHLRRFFGDGVKGDYLFLIDEAHNLVERSRMMYSAVLYKEQFLEIKRAVKDKNKKLVKLLDKCNRELLERKRECETYQILDGISGFAMQLLRLFSELEAFLEVCEDENLRNQILDFYFDVNKFLYIYERLDENYRIYTEHDEHGQFKIKLFCVQTAAALREYLDKGNSTIFFSATLLPIGYYKNLLGDMEEDYAIYAESTFPEDNRMVLLGNDVSSRYTRRSRQEFERIAAYIGAALQAKRGNYIVFFPSYVMMEQVLDCFLESGLETEYDYLVQSQGMGESGREKFLESFSEERERSLIGFCVMGGIFSEGIDLTHDRLIGVIVVGTGLPQISHEREILKQYYDEQEMNGFEYAYLFVGMNKVLQSAGRLIRTAEDKGIVMLLDDRFCQEQYKKLFPRE